MIARRPGGRPCMAERIEDYALIGDTQTARARRPRRLDRLAVPAALRLGRVLRGAARHAGQRPLADRARAEPARRRDARYRDDTLVLETEFETDDGHGRA